MSSSPIRKVKPSTIKNRSRNKKLAAIGILVAVVIVIVGFVMFGQNNSNANSSETSSPSPSTSPTATPTTSPSSSPTVTPSASPSASNATTVLLRTTMGNITIELRNDMPITTGNFRNLVQQGVYDGTIFHRVIKNFMIQGGDPTGTGYGDPSIPKIPDEFTSSNQNNRGTIAMANAGPNTGSSQFFINVVNNNYLDTMHPAFGTIIQGMDVVDAISKVVTDSNDRPLQEVIIIKAEIIN